MSRMSEHSLLAPPDPAYTNVTVRRAFIVWLHCGQINKFKDVCNYFHYLEELEDKLSAENRAISRHHEFDLFENPPPSSNYLKSHHPNLYTPTELGGYYASKLEAIKNEKCVFKLEGFKEIGPNNGTTKKEIVKTSQLIRKYCLSHSLTLKKFLSEFKEYAAKSELKYSVQNLTFYIKRQMIKEELTMIANCPKTFSFLDDDFAEDDSTNFLLRQQRLLDSVKLSPPQRLDGADGTWRNEHLRSNIKNASTKKSSQNQHRIATPKHDISRFELYQRS